MTPDSPQPTKHTYSFPHERVVSRNDEVTQNSTFFVETGDTIPELSIPPIPILIVSILGSWQLN